MGTRIIIDTNAFLMVANREPGYENMVKILDMVDEGQIHALISVISIAEISVGYHLSGDSGGLRDLLLHIRSSENYSIVDIDIELAEYSGKVRAETQLRLPDAIILASGIISGAGFLITEDTQFKPSEQITPSRPEDFLMIHS